MPSNSHVGAGTSESQILGALERLIAADKHEWSHPTEILGRPCPAFSDLLDACLARLSGTNVSDAASGTHLESVREKLERAVKIDNRARLRRLELRPAF